MLILKKGNELNWFDLLNIESPLMAKRTIQSNHGNRVGSETVHNANEHGLPSNRATSFDPYGVINDKLDNGQVFLVNSSTSMPVIKRLDVTSDNTAQWKLHSGQNLMFINAMDAALHHVPLPGQYSVLRSEPAQTSSDSPVVQNNTREKHIFLFNAKVGAGEVLPESHAVLMVVLNSTKNTVPVKQQKNIITDAFSRTITAEQGDSFKVYAIQEHRTDLKRELNSNNNLNSAETSNHISVLSETHAETRADGVLLHHMEYTLPVNPELTLIRIKQTAHTTIGELSINTLPSKKWYVLEPGGPDSNEGGGKRIPIGEYPIKKYTSRSFPGEYEISGVEGRSKIIMYEYEKSKGMMPGLCPGMSYELKDGEYLVKDSIDAKNEVYKELLGALNPKLTIKTKIKDKLNFVLKRIKETEITTISELYEKDNPNKKWYVVESAGPDSEVKEHSLRLKASTYSLKAYRKQTGEYKHSIELLGAGSRSPAIIAKAISFKKRDGTASMYIGNSYTHDEQWGIYELENGDIAAKELFDLMSSFPKAEIKIENAAGFTSSESQLKVSKGQLTFDIEGDERYRDADNPLFSRRPHWPGGVSGVTIGRGYDLGQQGDIKEVLQETGVEEPFLSWLAGAEGKKGKAAKKYLKDMPDNIKGRCITRKQQQELFLEIIDIYEEAAEEVVVDKIYEGMTRKLVWSDLSKVTQETLVDMRYRGDLKPATMDKIGKLIEQGGAGFKDFVTVPGNMTGIVTALPPQNRCDARKQHLES